MTRSKRTSVSYSGIAIFAPLRTAAWIMLMMISMPTLFAQGHQHKHIGSNLMVEAKAGYGFLIPHRQEMEIFNAHFPSFEISISRKTDGRQRWEYRYAYPIIGVAYWYSNLGTSPHLGDAHALFPYINFPISPNKLTRLYFRGGVGLGYLTKHFDRLENYKNIAIGSRLNAAVSMSIELRTKIMNRIYFTGSIGLTHFSNGSMKTPNFGINIPTVNAGVVYKLSKENPYKRSKLQPELYPYEFDGKKFFQIQFGTGLGYKNMEAEAGGKYGVFALYANVLKQVSFKSRIGVGFDLSYDGTDKHLIETGTGETPEGFLPVVKTGGNLAWEMMMSRVSLVLNVGGYFSGAYKREGGIYEKISIWYYINPKLFTSITLKAHYARADYITLGMGYNINIKYY
ncbi:MAG: acyloxyacyl hydrolase [Bacteroidota bacterium]